MADNLRKFTTQEVLNKVYTDSSGNTIGLQAQTSKETLNAVLNTSTNSLNVSLSGSNTISGDVTITGDLTVQGNGTGNYDEIVQGNLEISETLRLNPTISSGSKTTLAFMRSDANKWRFIQPHDDSYLKLYNDGASDTQMYFASNNSIGIATNSPVAQGLTVANAGDVNLTLLADSDANADNNWPMIDFRVDNTSGNPEARIYYKQDITSLVLATSNTNAVYVDENQNVGIGGTPSNQLTVVADSAIKNINIHTNVDAAIVSPTDAGARIFTTGDGGSGIYAENGHLAIQGRPSSARDIIFLTGDSASEVMRLTGDGLTGIGMSPTEFVDIEKSDNTPRALQFSNTNNGTNASGGFKATSNAGTLFMRSISSSFTTSGRNVAGTSQILSTSTSGLVIASTVDIQFWTDTAKRMVLDDNSRISLSNNDGGDDNTIFGKSAGDALTTNGDENVLIGHEAGNDMTTGERNVIIGYQSGDRLTSGDRSVAIGYGSLGNEQTGGRSIAIGFNALSQQNIGANTYNTALGVEAGFHNRTGTGNTFLGYNSGKGASEESNSNNVGVGYQTLLNITTGANNIAIGKDSSDAITSGSANVAIGTSSLGANTTAHNNVAVGTSVLQSLNTSSQNTAIGSSAMSSITNASGLSNCVAIGYQAFQGGVNTTNGAVGTVAVGMNSLFSLTTGASNTAIGYKSGENVTSGGNSVMIGNEAGNGVSTSFYHVLIGDHAGHKTLSDHGSVAVGYYALANATSGGYNTAIGYQALEDNVSGEYSTALGYQSLANATGEKNTAVGYQSADALTTGVDNVVIGYSALSASTDADDTIAIGSGAMQLGDVSGDANIGIGKDVLQDLTTGAGNICIGKNSGKNLTAGSLNTFIGHLSGGSGTDTEGPGSYNVCIGEEAGYLLQRTGGGAGGEKNIFIGQAAGDTCTTGIGNVIIGRTADVSDVASENRIGIGMDVNVGVNNAVVLGNNNVTAVYMAQNSGATVHCAGIDFSATQPAPNAGTSTSEVLDGYEEGTWTPLPADASSSGNTASAGTATGHYTRIGRIVHCTFSLININTTGMTTSNDFFIQGLPFAIATHASHAHGSVALENVNFTGEYVTISPAGGTSAIRLAEVPDNGNIDIVMVSEINDDSADIYGHFTYMA
jgi:hypothetical protein